MNKPVDLMTNAADKSVEPRSFYKYNCVDLFAGAGGFSLAAIESGLHVKAAVEFDKSACLTYKENMPHVQSPAPVIYSKDILKLSPKDILDNDFAEGEVCDIVLGGPPCQGFSRHRIKDAGVDDDRNILILRYFEYVRALRPKLFLMENVPGITWARHKEYLDVFYEEGAASDYQVLDPVIIDAADYGVPQHRKRVFILGIRNDFADIKIEWPPKKTHTSKENLKKTIGLKEWRLSAEIFSTPLRNDDVNNIHMNHRPDLIKVFESTPLNGGSRKDSNRVLPCHDKHNGHSDVYGRIDPNKPGPTMTTACVNPSKGRFLHPTEHHGITVRHAARFQTFPDWFKFKGGIMAGAKQVGNAVPVELGKVLIKSLTLALDRYFLDAAK